jgi:hypothetical protein
MNDEDRIHQELTRVANSRPKSGRGLQAKFTALRTLEQMRRAEGADYGGVDPALVARLFDDRDDDERVSPDDWYPESGDPEGDATMRELDATSTLGQRRRLFLNFERGGRAMSRPSILNDRGERESLPIVVGGGRVLGVMVDVGEQSPARSLQGQKGDADLLSERRGQLQEPVRQQVAGCRGWRRLGIPVVAGCQVLAEREPPKPGKGAGEPPSPADQVSDQHRLGAGGIRLAR